MATAKCKRKIGYTKAEAKEAVRIRTKHKGGSYYRCDQCGRWHITKQKKNFISNNTWMKICGN